MTPAHFVFWLTCLPLVNMAQKKTVSLAVRQKSSVLSAESGETLTLECSYETDEAAKFSWYKLTLGQKPQLISTVFKYGQRTFYNEFENNPRFSLDSGKGKNHLIITELQPSDTATYYCSSGYMYNFEFGNGTTVFVKGSDSNVQTLVHQVESEAVQPGGHVTLTCTAETGSCDGEHSVYWFRNNGESVPGLLYSRRGRNDQCGQKTQERTRSCRYSLLLQNLTGSQAGTYYCAVASCGHIVFGNGTKLGFKDEVNSMHLLTGALAFTSFLSFLQALLLFRIYRRKNSNTSEPHSRLSHPDTRTAESEDQDEEDLQYAGLRLQKVYTSTGQDQRNEMIDCVYSAIKK
ncbi:immunoglobulin kappa light chain-like [Xiphophorus hellerii]|uniref:immunoglobulin kappa light chain-like n=1 Tax=Xiphophorus hellerii TaxID=8084 RepID=UPI0013B41FF5|nr:immunoglobulin kappa light chain-like [Xiphophorus hellerii]